MSWQKIGDVVDAVGSGRRQLYQGKEYDYVFDVDVEEGAPPLKLPYNVTGKYISSSLRNCTLMASTRQSIQCCSAFPRKP